MTIQKLFESLDESVFTDELKQSLSEKFESAVEEKSQVNALLLAEELAEFKIDELSEKAEQYGEYLMHESQEKINEFQKTITERVSDYMDLVVQEFVSEAEEALGESLKNEHADMLVEAFDSMLVAGGVEFATIMEAKDKTQGINESDANQRVDKLVEEIILLKEENSKLIKMGLISEMCEGLTLVQAERFRRFADLVEFDNSPRYAEKLDTILESITESKEKPKDEVIVESDKQPKETKQTKDMPSWSHLV